MKSESSIVGAAARHSSAALAVPVDWQPHLHGLRGLAASYVVLFHVWQMFIPSPSNAMSRLPSEVWRAMAWMRGGRLAVSVFIVLSGYLLMGPVVRSGGVLRGGGVGFLRRRVRRILPPYYAALVASVFLGLLFPEMGMALRRKEVFSHLCLFHNLRNQWAYAINGPMWSVATEFQIYLLFPIMLLPLWRRWGSLAAIAGGFALGLAPKLFMTGLLEDASPWYIGLFASGMAASSIVGQGRFGRVPWLTFASAFGIAMIVVVRGPDEPGVYRPSALAESLAGGSAACLLVHLAGRGRGGPLARFLSSKWLVELGVWSYSLYLVHGPVLSLASAEAHRLRLPPLAALAWFLTAGAATFVIAYLFFLAVESRFLPPKVAVADAVILNS